MRGFFRVISIVLPLSILAASSSGCGQDDKIKQIQQSEEATKADNLGVKAMEEAMRNQGGPPKPGSTSKSKAGVAPR